MDRRRSSRSGRWHGAHERIEGTRICASYINYYIGNTVVVVPEFDDPMDEPAQAVLRGLFPNHEIIGIKNAHGLLIPVHAKCPRGFNVALEARRPEKLRQPDIQL
jgi:hypothetical protein